jgi:uncharacterized protein YbjT (DUF2867 family)
LERWRRAALVPSAAEHGEAQAPDPQVRPTSDSRLVTVFGGTGFLGRRVVGHLVGHGIRVRVAVRHPEAFEHDSVERVRADVTDERSVASALVGADAAVNAVSLYVEKRGLSFHAIHVDAAQRVARLAREAGLRTLVHVSGIGSDPQASNDYIRARGRGELAVRAAFPAATLVRPSVMFAADDAFLTTLVRLARRLPVYPLFGRGETRLQPVHVEDVAEAIARIIMAEKAADAYELAGPDVWTYRELVQEAAKAAGARARLVSVPFPLWGLGARVSEMIPGAPLTRAQVDLMREDNVASGGLSGFDELGIVPQQVAPGLRAIAAVTSRARRKEP